MKHTLRKRRFLKKQMHLIQETCFCQSSDSYSGRKTCEEDGQVNTHFNSATQSILSNTWHDLKDTGLLLQVMRNLSLLYLFKNSVRNSSRRCRLSTKASTASHFFQLASRLTHSLRDNNNLSTWLTTQRRRDSPTMKLEILNKHFMK